MNEPITPAHKRAVALGWEPYWAPYGQSTAYSKDGKHLRRAGTNFPSVKLWWVCSDLIDGEHCDFAKYDTLDEALEVES